MNKIQNSFIIFLHIQKTGGITLQRILRRKLGQSLVARGYHLIAGKERSSSFEEVLKSKQMSDRYFSGHVCFGVHRFLPHPFTYMALLREPVARIISLYHYSKTNPTAYYHGHAVDKTLEDFVLKAPLMELDNGQTRFLAGDEQDCFINRTPIGQCNEHLLELAKHNMEQHFSFIGLTEYFEQSMLLLSKIMGWNHCLYLKRNVSKQKINSQISPELRQAIAERNWLDVQLYDYAKQRFLNQLAQHNLDCPELLEHFQVQNQRFNLYWEYPYTVYDFLKAILRGQVGRPS